jgi:uncharacterized protein YkwD
VLSPRIKTRISIQVVLVVGIGVLGSCAPRPEPQPWSRWAAPRPSCSLANQLFQEVNSYRQSQGKPALILHPGLDQLAEAHCEFLRRKRGTFSLHGKNVSHYGAEGRATNARNRYQMGAVSENVAAVNPRGENTTPILMKLWTTSKGHEANLCNSWTHTGIGIVVDSDGMVFATEVFGCLYCSNLSFRNRFNGR